MGASASQSGNFALAAQAGGALLGAFGAFKQGEADATASKYQAGVAQNNARFAKLQADELQRRAKINAADAIERGQQLQVNKALEYRKMIGRQQAMLAHNGVVVNQDSALSLIQDAHAFAALDQETVLANAQREAIAIQTGAMDQVMALDQQSNNYLSEAELLQSRATYSTQAGYINAGAQLIAGAGNVASTAFKFDQAGVDTLLT